MKNKVEVSNTRYQTIKMLAILLLIPTALAIFVLFTFRSLDTRNYSGQVTEVSGTVISIDKNGDDDGIEITLSDNVVYNGNPLRSSYPDFDLNTLLGKEVTFVLPERQVGQGRIPTWILGVKQGDETLLDYHKIIADGKSEAKLGMIISGSIAVLFAIASLVIFSWKTRISPSKEESLYKAYAEFAALLQPSCPQYKHVGIATVIYLVVGLLLVALPISIVGTVTDNVTIQIAVGVSMSCLFVGISAAYIIYAFKLANKERDFYAENFPFDLDDISHVSAYGKQKKVKQETQEKLREERKKFPHRYFDAGNGYIVDFTENGVELLDEKDGSEVPNTDFVFGDGEEKAPLTPIYKFGYQELHFEALAHYRKKDHPLTVVIKSRIEDDCAHPEEMCNDLHILLDSNLLATLHHFGVEVENLQYILDNKAQLIRENCVRHKKRK